MSYDIEIVVRRAQPAFMVHGNVTVAGIPAFLGGAFGAAAAVAGRQGLPVAGPPFGRYTPQPDGSYDVQAGLPVSGVPQPVGEVTVTELPAGTAARAVHVGAHTVELAYEAVEKWLAEHDYVTVGAPWESYLDEPGTEKSRTEVVFPCLRRFVRD